MCHAKHVVGPYVLFSLGKARRMKFELPIVSSGFKHQLVVTARSDRDVCVEADRAGKDETIVVVSVFANEVYASRRPEYFGMSVEFLFEDLRQFIRLEFFH